MARKFDALLEEIDKLALSMVSDPPNNATPETYLKRDQIVGKLDKYYASQCKHGSDVLGNELYYYPPIGKKIPHHLFYDLIMELLSPKKNAPDQWRFDPTKSASFTSVFHFQLNKRLNTYQKKYYSPQELYGITQAPRMISTDKLSAENAKSKKQFGGVTSLDEPIFMQGENSTTLKDVLPAEENWEEEERFSKDSREGELLARVLLDLKAVFKNYNAKTADQKRAAYFCAFFTFDTVKHTKYGSKFLSLSDQHALYSKYDALFFPLMRIALLEFLMTGTFEKMWDIVQNQLRDYVDLAQKQDLLRKHLGITRQSVGTYLKKYDQVVENLQKKALTC